MISTKNKFTRLLLCIAFALCLLTSISTQALAAVFSEKSATDVTISSSIFTSSKYMSISPTDEGLSIRATENDTAYTSFAKNVYTDGFKLNFVINNSNFEELIFTFEAEYLQNWSNVYGATNNIENWVALPENIVNTVVLTKTDAGKIQAKLNDNDAVLVDSKFDKTAIELFLDGNTAKINATALKGSLNPMPRKEAKLSIKLSNVHSTTTEVDKQVANLLIEKISYLNNILAENETSLQTISQSFKSETKIEDTSMPMVRFNNDMMPLYMNSSGVIQDGYACSVGTQLSLPLYIYDVFGSTPTKTIKYKYSETPVTNWFEKVDGIDKYQTREMPEIFTPEKEGYYAIVEIIVSDIRNTVTLSKDDIIDGITLPIVYRALVKEDRVENYPDFNHKMYEQYLDTFDIGNNGNVNGGKDTVLSLPYPQIGIPTANPMLSDCIGVDGAERYYHANAKALTYELWFKTVSANSFTKFSGLNYTTSTAGVQEFYLVITDNKGFSSVTKDMDNYFTNPEFSTFKFDFYDNEKPEITVNSFPTEKYLNQKFTLPTGSVSDNMSSPAATVEVWMTEIYTGTVKGVAQYEKMYNYLWLYDYEKDDDGNFKLDKNGKKIIKKDSEGHYIYLNAEGEVVPATERIVATDEQGRKLYLDADGNETTEIPDLPGLKIDLVSSGFTPIFKGKFVAIYSAKDNALPTANEADQVFRYFEVVDIPTTSFWDIPDSLNVFSIVFLSIALACLVGIVVLIFVKPKEE